MPIEPRNEPQTVVPQDVPQLRPAAAAACCAVADKEMRTASRLQPAAALRASGGLYRARSAGPAGPQRELVHHEPLLPGRLRPVQRGPEPAAAASARRRGYRQGRAACPDLPGLRAGALASNGQGPPSITDRLRSTADGAQAAEPGGRRLAAPPGRSRVRAPERDAPIPQPQPPPQIIGRPGTRRAARAGGGAGRLPH